MKKRYELLEKLSTSDEYTTSSFNSVSCSSPASPTSQGSGEVFGVFSADDIKLQVSPTDSFTGKFNILYDKWNASNNNIINENEETNYSATIGRSQFFTSDQRLSGKNYYIAEFKILKKHYSNGDKFEHAFRL